MIAANWSGTWDAEDGRTSHIVVFCSMNICQEYIELVILNLLLYGASPGIMPH